MCIASTCVPSALWSDGKSGYGWNDGGGGAGVGYPPNPNPTPNAPKTGGAAYAIFKYIKCNQ